ncbi:endolytic transglycosylase MltG [Corynebacterium sp. 4HC-13]|uniref:Endolytic murein transglycosylase n=2 Tax=Corynebacterium anserum TaxID=2684406 RepID=A0A7G7YR22_9CORY|nr:endolytic transglycosylase MltG [Corynebacterium anserum]QNH96942.1 endolytic transglycosylase MltG [Corynebacterium anserum]
MEPKYRRRRQRAGALAIALVILLIGVTGYVWYQRSVVADRDFVGSGNGNIVMVRVDAGDSIYSLAPELVDKGVIGSRRALVQAAEVTQPSLQQGYYPLQEKMSAKEALKALTNDDLRRGVVDIPNGLTLDDVRVVGGNARKGIYSLVSAQTCQDKQNCVSVDDLKNAVTNTSPEELGVPSWAIDAVNKRGKDPRRIEGLIAPGVHLFDPTMSPVDIMKDLVSDSARVFEDTGLVASAKKVGLSPYDVIIAASLVEREAPAGDFDKVARVILNRLNIKQKLEFDSTVNYGLDEQEVATTDADRQRETPWNTYAKQGLPDTPIASPGLQALHAVENPAQGDWLYFVTVDKNGRTVFNRDFAAHEQAIEESRANGVLDSNR